MVPRTVVTISLRRVKTLENSSLKKSSLCIVFFLLVVMGDELFTDKIQPRLVPRSRNRSGRAVCALAFRDGFRRRFFSISSDVCYRVYDSKRVQIALQRCMQVFFREKITKINIYVLNSSDLCSISFPGQRMICRHVE